MRAATENAFLMFSLAAGLCHGSLTVQTQNGFIQGATCPDTPASSFLSIPYATPPIGELRFAPPRPFSGSFGNNGTLLATKAAPACIQFGPVDSQQFFESEDCLYLNVFAPADASATAATFPVKVFVHGGGDLTGGISDTLINGCYSSTDAIVVTVGYRLGPLGWLSSEPAGLTGNYGIQDQVLALQWVQTNIQAFGGDPTKVLLIGQSAGAMNVFSIAASNQAPSLMRAAVMESGGGMDFATKAQASAWDELFTKTLGCSFADLSCLRTKTPAEMVAANRRMPTNQAPIAWTLLTSKGRGPTWGPIVDGQVVAVQPSEAGVKVPSIFGSNAKEGSIFVYSQYTSKAFGLTDADWRVFLQENFGNLSDQVGAQFSPFASPANSAFDVMSAIITDSAFRCTAMRSARTAKAPAFVYLFGHVTECNWVPGVPETAAFTEAQGATHTAELPYVFGITKGLPRGCSFNAAEQALSAFMISSWTSMAATGTPGTAWPAFGNDTAMGVVFGASDTPEVKALDAEGCKFWDQIDVEISKLVEKVTPPTIQPSPSPTVTVVRNTTGPTGGTPVVETAANGPKTTNPSSGASRGGRELSYWFPQSSVGAGLVLILLLWLG